ncbi:enoyl-CoA hydratase/isomerase family protein [Nocardia gipuzkoensis]
MVGVHVQDRGRVRVMTLDDPARHNCLSRVMAIDIAETVTKFSRDDSVDVLVITGAGEKSFCSGMDLRGMQEVADHFWTYLAGPLGFARLDAGKPTIAAVNGYCFAGGMELASWCDFRIASENAEFGALNRRWGVPFTYPQASLRADRQAAIRGDGLPLAEGLKLELDLTVPTAWDPGTAEGLRRYDVGDRPATLR